MLSSVSGLCLYVRWYVGYFGGCIYIRRERVDLSSRSRVPKDRAGGGAALHFFGGLSHYFFLLKKTRSVFYQKKYIILFYVTS